MRLAKNLRPRLSQDAEDGVKWNIQRGCCARHGLRAQEQTMGLIRLLAALIVGGAHAIDDIQAIISAGRPRWVTTRLGRVRAAVAYSIMTVFDSR